MLLAFLYTRVLGVLCQELGVEINIYISYNFTMHYESCRQGEKGAESQFEEVMTENFPNLKKETDTQS